MIDNDDDYDAICMFCFSIRCKNGIKGCSSK